MFEQFQDAIQPLVNGLVLGAVLGFSIALFRKVYRSK